MSLTLIIGTVGPGPVHKNRLALDVAHNRYQDRL